MTIVSGSDNSALTTSAIGGGVLGAGLAGGLNFVSQRNFRKYLSSLPPNVKSVSGDTVKFSAKCIKGIAYNWKSIAKFAGVGALVGVGVATVSYMIGSGIKALFNIGKK